MKDKNVLKIGTYYMFANFFNKGLAFITIPIFTRILSTYDYGMVNTYTSWVNILSILLGLSMGAGIKVAYIDYKKQINGYLSSIIFFILCYDIITIICILTVCHILNFSNISYIFICLMGAMAYTILEDFNIMLMMEYKYKYRTILMIAPNFFAVIISILLIYKVSISEKYYLRIVPMMLIDLILAVFVIIYTIKNGNCTLKKEYIKYGLKISIPNIFHVLSLSILSQSDRIMLTSLKGAEEAGIYSLIYNIGLIAIVFTTALEGIWIPWFMEKIKNGKKKLINKIAKEYINFIASIILIILFVSPEIIKMLSPSKYWGGIPIIAPIVISSFVMFLYTFYVNIECFNKKTIMTAISTLIAASTNLILNFIFIPQYGFYAAACTTLVGYCLSLYLHYKFARKLEPELFPANMMIKYLLMLVISVLLFYCFLKLFIIRWLLAIIIICIVIFKYKDKIILFIKK